MFLKEAALIAQCYIMMLTGLTLINRRAERERERIKSSALLLPIADRDIVIKVVGVVAEAAEVRT